MAQHQSSQDAVFKYARGADPRAFRNAMGGFATGVTVVTTMSGDTPVGVTANSFTSVSLDPALVLVCLGKSLGCLEAFSAEDLFAINVLRTDQRALSARFATKGVDRFAGTDWGLSPSRLPLISQALANIECSKYAQLDYGDHMIFIGEVLHATCDPRHDPLLYFGGEYRRLHEAAC